MPPLRIQACGIMLAMTLPAVLKGSWRLHAPTAAAERSALNKAAQLCMRMCVLCGDVGACKIDDDGEGKPIVICQNDPYCRQSPRYDCSYPSPLRCLQSVDVELRSIPPLHDFAHFMNCLLVW